VRKVELSEAKRKLSELVERAVAGERTGITRSGELAAVIVPAIPKHDVSAVFKHLEQLRKKVRHSKGMKTKDLIEVGRSWARLLTLVCSVVLIPNFFVFCANSLFAREPAFDDFSLLIFQIFSVSPRLRGGFWSLVVATPRCASVVGFDFCSCLQRVVRSAILSPPRNPCHIGHVAIL
jgi:prevent-host-death family protein